jgi:hypothetical protein
MDSGPSCQLLRPLNHAYRSPGPAHKRHYAGHHRWPTLCTALPPPPVVAVIAARLICARGLREVLRSFTFSPLARQLCRAALSRGVPPPSSPPSASTSTGHSDHPSASSPPPRAPQPLRGHHRPPRNLPWPVVYLYRRRSPPPTHTTADGLTGEHPSSPLPPNGSPISLCRSSRRLDPPHRRGSPKTGRHHRPWPWSHLPCLCSTMDHQPMGGLLA